MHPILADFQSALDKITADTPNLALGGGGLFLSIVALMVRKRILRFVLLGLAVAAIAGAVYLHLQKS